MRNFSLSALLATLLFTLSVAATAAPATPEAAPAPAAMMQTSTVNLNKADADTIQRELAGIGMAKALAIVAHRDANGVFTSVDELLEVKGIGKSLLDKNRDRLTVE